MTKQINLFEGKVTRTNMQDSIQLSIASLNEYAKRHKHWVVCWSGGKDSTAATTFLIWAIETKQIPKPESIKIFYADTRLELLPLWLSAQNLADQMREKGFTVETVMAPVEKRFLTYILGVGVPPSNNTTFRWCTRQIKVDPMIDALKKQNQGIGEKVLSITGVRLGESSIRDSRIVMSCSKGDGECGQGWYQSGIKDSITSTLAPLIHWRVCHVWEWLKHWAPLPEFGDWDTELLATVYGGSEAEDIHARTGCVGCPLTDKDTALDHLLKNPQYNFLHPIKRIRPIWRALRLPKNRLRKHGERNKNGELSANPCRMGALTMEARKWAYNQILCIEADINKSAPEKFRFTLLNDEEKQFIHECWENNVWPDKWDGTEDNAAILRSTIYNDGTEQPLLFSENLFGN